MVGNRPQRAFQRCGLFLLPAAWVAVTVLVATLLAAAQGPPDPAERFEHWSALARQAGEAKDFTKFARAYSEMEALRPGEAWIHRGLGLAYHMQSMHQEAVAPLEKAVALDAALPGAALYLGISYYRANRFREAAATLAKSREIAGEQALAHYWLGAAQRALGQHRQAIASLARAVKSNPEDLEAIHLLARGYAEYSDELHATLSRVALESSAARVLAAKDLMANGVWEAALTAVDRAITADGTFAEAHLLKERILSRQGRSYPEASPFSKIFDENLRRRTPAAAHLLHDVLDASPDDPGALYELGEIYARLSRETAETLLDLYPNSYRARLLRGEALEKSVRLEFDKALTEFQKAADLRPDAPGVHSAIGRVLWLMNRFDEAAPHLQWELRLNPHHGTANLLLGRIYLDRGEAGLAIKHLRSAVKAQPGSLEAGRTLARAGVLRGRNCNLPRIARRPPERRKHPCAAGRRLPPRRPDRRSQVCRQQGAPASGRNAFPRTMTSNNDIEQ